MKKYLVVRKDDEVVVAIFRNKVDDTYSFINLTKEHICPCKFNSVEDAIEDMNRQMKDGKIIKYFEINDRK